MTPPHTIRLSAGWTRDGDRHARRFQWPKPLPEGESLWLALTFSAAATVTLNGVRLAECAAGEWSALLTAVGARNELVVETSGEVTGARLEVHATGGR